MTKQLKCLGAIIGDIVGSPYEFVDFSEYSFQLFDETRSFFTDDTVLTVAVMDKLINNLSYEAAFIKWTDKYPDCSWGMSFLHWLNSTEKKPYNSCGNGSAMRVSPIAWAYDSLEEVREEARKSSEITHNHSEGIKAAEAIASAIFLARTKHSKSEIQHYLENNFGYNLDRSVSEVAFDYKYSELAQKSVPESIIAFLDGESFEDTIRLAVSLDGDADTMTAIAGSIAEAYYGIPDDIYNQALEFLSEDILAVIKSFQEII